MSKKSKQERCGTYFFSGQNKEGMGVQAKGNNKLEYCSKEGHMNNDWNLIDEAYSLEQILSECSDFINE